MRWYDETQAPDDLTTIDFNIPCFKFFILHSACLLHLEETMTLDQLQGRTFTLFLKTMVSSCGPVDLSSSFQVRLSVSNLIYTFLQVPYRSFSHSIVFQITEESIQKAILWNRGRGGWYWKGIYYREHSVSYDWNEFKVNDTIYWICRRQIVFAIGVW